MVPMSGVATQKLQAGLPSCYSQTYDECVDDPNSHPGSKCTNWYNENEAAYQEDKEEYKRIMDGFKNCEPGYSLPVVAIAAAVGLLIGAIIL